MGDEVPKVSERLAAELSETLPEDAVEVIIELRPPDAPADSPTASRGELVAARRDAFEEWSASVADRLRSVGGVVVDTAWINSTLKGVVQAQKVSELAEDEKVERIDTGTVLIAE